MFVYSGNRFALSCADCLIKGHAPFTVLYVYGEHWAGKTELLRHIERGVFENDSSKIVERIPARELEDKDYSELSKIKEACKACDVVLIDDVQYALMSSSVSDYMLQMIDTLHVLNKKIVMTCDRDLRELSKSIPSSLADRLAFEMPVRLRKVSPEECVNALCEFSKDVGFDDNQNAFAILKLIAEAENWNLGASLATFRRILVRAQLMNCDVNLEFAKDVIYSGESIELIS